MPPEHQPLGIFGGTFDPIHYGHLRLAEEARQQLRLPTIRWIPAGQPKHREAPAVSASQRLAMVRLALTGHSGFELDPAEACSDQPSYTVPTLERLRAELGTRRPLVLLLGADAFAGLTTWHRWQDLLQLAHLAISHRPGFVIDPTRLPEVLAREYTARHLEQPARLTEHPAGSIITFAMTQLAISATHIRSLLAAGESPRYLLPDAVIDYIRRHQLYRKL